MFLPALVAKFLSLGAVAQAASGVGIAVVAFTGAGATGMLGENVQTGLTSVVGAAGTSTSAAATTTDASPSSSPSASPTETPAVQSPAVVTPAAATPTFDAKAWALNGPAAGQSFGEWVREAARAGKADGAVISAWAHKKHVDLSTLQGTEDGQGDDESSSSATATATATHEVETEHSAETTHGGSEGHGGGNSGHGHN